MDISRCTAILDRQSLILVCPDREKRTKVTELLAAYLGESGKYKVYRLAEPIKSDEKYLRQAVKVLPMLSPLKIPKEQMSLDQIEDVQLDWLVPGKKNAIVIPDLQRLALEDPEYFSQLVSVYFTRSYELRELEEDKDCFRFLFSLDAVPASLLEKLQLYVGHADSRSIADIAAAHVGVYRYP